MSSSTQDQPRPSPRAYGIVIRDDAVLLVRAANPSNDDDWWWLPGGGIDFLESPADAVVREFHEETGLHAHSPVLLDVQSDVRRRQNGEVVHSIRIIYRVEVADGELVHEVGGSTDMARWFKIHELDDIDIAPYARLAIDQVR